MKKKTMLFPLVLLLAGLACSLPGVGGGEATPTQPAESLLESIEQAVEDAEGTGVFTVTLSEAQVTAFLAEQLAQQTDPVFKDPEVELHPDEMTISGDYKVAEGIFANAEITLKVAVDENGNPVVEPVSGSVGPVEIPVENLALISDYVMQFLTDEAGGVVTTESEAAVTVGVRVYPNSGRWPTQFVVTMATRSGRWFHHVWPTSLPLL